MELKPQDTLLVLKYWSLKQSDQESIAKATKVTLPSGIKIRVVTPAYFVATKFEAFAGRGEGDYFSVTVQSRPSI